LLQSKSIFDRDGDGKIVANEIGYAEKNGTVQKDFFESLQDNVAKGDYKPSSALNDASEKYKISQTSDKLSSVEGQKKQVKNRTEVLKAADKTLTKVFDEGYDKLVQNGFSPSRYRGRFTVQIKKRNQLFDFILINIL